MKVIYGISVNSEIIKNFKDEFLDAYKFRDNSFICGLKLKDEPLNYLKLDFKEYDEFIHNTENQEKLNQIIQKTLKIWVDFIQEKTLELKKQNKSVEEVDSMMSKYDLPENIEVEFFIIGD